MIQTWKIENKTSHVSEELLDEKIEVTFTQAKSLFTSGKQNLDIESLNRAFDNFNELAINKRLLALSTDRHKVILFDTYYCLAEVHYIKDNYSEAMQLYLKAVRIRDDHRDWWFKMGEILKTTNYPTYPGRLNWYLKALDVNKCEDNTTIIMRVCDIYFLSSEFHKWRKTLDIILKRIPNSIEYLMMKSFILSLNAATIDESEYILEKARTLTGRKDLEYINVDIILQYFTLIKSPSLNFAEQTQQISKCQAWFCVLK